MKIKLYCDKERVELKSLDFAILTMLEGSKNGFPSVVTIMNK